MLSQKMLELGKKSSVIREIFEYGNRRRAEIGAENVYDFSLGNPSVPAPSEVNEAIKNLIDTKSSVALHGYTSAPGDLATRTAIAENLNKRFSADASASLIYMTCGAAASLTISLNAILCENEEVIVPTPYFPEYKVFIEKAGGKVVEVPTTDGTFQLDVEKIEKAINKNTKAIILNSPNNPTGVVFKEESLKNLAELLNKKQKEFGTEIYILADEPYRELVYGKTPVPFIPSLYDRTIVCYSYSKSLSLPGERIGYIFVSPKNDNASDIFAAVCGAGRSLGYVCAPSILQYTIKDCVDLTTNVEAYRKNRDIFYNFLTETGYSVTQPDGAFYLFVKSLEKDANAFCERAKKHEILIVPSDSFGVEGYVRISYCVATETIEKSLEGFKKLYLEYNGEK